MELRLSCTDPSKCGIIADKNIMKGNAYYRSTCRCDEHNGWNSFLFWVNCHFVCGCFSYVLRWLWMNLCYKFSQMRDPSRYVKTPYIYIYMGGHETCSSLFGIMRGLLYNQLGSPVKLGLYRIIRGPTYLSRGPYMMNGAPDIYMGVQHINRGPSVTNIYYLCPFRANVHYTQVIQYVWVDWCMHVIC